MIDDMANWRANLLALYSVSPDESEVISHNARIQTGSDLLAGVSNRRGKVTVVPLLSHSFSLISLIESTRNDHLYSNQFIVCLLPIEPLSPLSMLI